MCDFVVLKRRMETSLVCGRSVWQRLVGVVLGGVALVLIVMVKVVALSLFGVTLIVAGSLFVIGLYYALPGASFVFEAHSPTCLVRPGFFALRRGERRIAFSSIVVQRRFDWQLLRWLYRIVLTGPDPADGQALCLGYVPRRIQCRALAQTMAQFTDTVAVDWTGRPLADPPEDAVA